MILVLTNNTYEQGTDPVIDWLVYYGVPFKRITTQDLLSRKHKYCIDILNNDIIIDGISLLNDVSVVWYRRFSIDQKLHLDADDEQFREQLSLEVKYEYKHLVDYIFSVLETKPCLPNPNKIETNKLIMQKKAEQCGLKNPSSKVLNNKESLLNFLAESPHGLISKPINFCGYYNRNEYSYTVFTNVVDTEYIRQTPEFFAPTLFQQKIDGVYEIRCFYIDGQFFPTVTLNQNPTKDVDKKLYMKSKETHLLPYKFPESEEKKIDNFMRSVGLTTGTLDIMLDTDGNYTFIEVNPVGQYWLESIKCNYNLDKVMADWLVEKENIFNHQKAVLV